MSAKVINPDFFKTKSYSGVASPAGSGPKPSEDTVSREEGGSPIKVKKELLLTLRELQDTFAASNQKAFSAQIERIDKTAVNDRFSIAVVGEFNKGKSTFINKLLGKDILPIGDLPTTAMLTRIRYNPKEILVLFNEKGEKEKTLPLSQSSWDGLTAENFGRDDPTGVVLAGVRSRWLGESNLEIMDTPGAGDLEERRAQVISSALLGCDGAIIAISATAPLSLSEKLFIEQRLLTRKTPFLMLIVTKLDQIPLSERAGVVEYIINKLALWDMDIPVFIPYEVELTDSKYQDMMGMDKIQERVSAWINDPQRVRLTEDWIAAQTLSVLETALSSLNEQKLLLEADDEKRIALIKEKKQQLSKAGIAWEKLRLQMLERCNDCYFQLLKKADEYKISIVERLQYEASHANHPQKWWTEDYPYRLKVELANMAAGVENVVSRRISDDAKWFNSALEQHFKTHILYEKETISEKELFNNSSSDRDVGFENIDKQRTAARVGTVALSIAGYAVCTYFGFIPLIATMGVGTGATLISEKVFKGKLEKQREAVKEAVAKNVPERIENAMCESEKRLKAVYDDMINATAVKESSWMDAQEEAIERSLQQKDTEHKKKVYEQISHLEQLRRKIQAV